MKKGIEYDVIVVFILALLVVAGVVYLILPRAQRAPSIVERFLPEKCEVTGKTYDEYLRAITDQVSAKKVPEAFAVYGEMKTCFPDAGIPPQLCAVSACANYLTRDACQQDSCGLRTCAWSGTACTGKGTA